MSGSTVCQETTQIIIVRIVCSFAPKSQPVKQLIVRPCDHQPISTTEIKSLYCKIIDFLFDTDLVHLTCISEGGWVNTFVEQFQCQRQSAINESDQLINNFVIFIETTFKWYRLEKEDRNSMSKFSTISKEMERITKPIQYITTAMETEIIYNRA